jgi:hypothetical protein
MRLLPILACTSLVACGSVPLDARLHAGAGGIAYTAQAALLPNTWRSTPFERCALATAAGVAKEAYDSTGRGNVEARDVVGTVVGCLVVDAVVQAVQGHNIWTGQPQ